jgi:hypothetical protein
MDGTRTKAASDRHNSVGEHAGSAHIVQIAKSEYQQAFRGGAGIRAQHASHGVVDATTREDAVAT